MAKTKDFFGKDITEVIEQACKFYDTTQDQLDIEVLETGSAGIFGLCRKQAHIRANQKTVISKDEKTTEPPSITEAGKQNVQENATIPEPAELSSGEPAVEVAKKEKDMVDNSNKVSAQQEPKDQKLQPGAKAIGEESASGQEDEAEMAEPPSQESLDIVSAAVNELLELMKCPSIVTVTSENSTVHCNISSEHEDSIIGPEGRTLDSLQYLLRKMLLQNLPERCMLSLDVGNFRERRAEELKERAVLLAAQVKEDGKTQAIPALNPSERRIVHMVLQEDKGIRSRSVGDGLFKKVLIYKPGKGRRSGSKKRKG